MFHTSTWSVSFVSKISGTVNPVRLNKRWEGVIRAALVESKPMLETVTHLHWPGSITKRSDVRRYHACGVFARAVRTVA